MMIHERYRGVGLGRALLSRLLGWARARGDILKVELGVMHTNAGGIALYEKLGFREEGRLLKKFRQADGSFEDDIEMGLWVG
ncbi:MAG: GNAT family N-acetyltransferase, partial [Planctomycetota bacterium]